MNLKHLVLPLFLAGAILTGCDDKTTKSTETDTKAANAKAEAQKTEADVKAKAEKTAANAKAEAAKVAADVKNDAAKVAAEASRDQATKLLSDLKTSVKDEKWTDAKSIMNQLDDLRDKLTADQRATYDSLKKQYDDKH